MIFCECPSCNQSTRGGVIPVEDRELFGQGGLTECIHGCGNEPHFTNTISVYDNVQNMTVSWICPHCLHKEDA